MFEDYITTTSIVLFLILLSAYFSASETGLTVVSRARIHKLRMEGNKRAILVSALRHDKDKLIGAVLLGYNAVNTAATALATSVLIKVFGNGEGIAYATLIITTLVLIFGEILPKSYAFSNAERVALIVAPSISFLVKILSPLLFILNSISKLFTVIFGIKTSALESARISGTEALRGTIELSHHEGAVVKQERDMLGSILDLGDTEVGEVMIHRKNMMSININQPQQKVIDQMVNNVFTRMPVWENNHDNIVGVLNTKDLLSELNKHKWDLGRISIREIMQKPWFIPDTTTLKDQLVAFREKRNHFALVVDEYGALLGLITLEDILEEIVGQIEDEHDQRFAGISHQSDGSYIVDGTVTVRDLNRQLDWHLPDDKAATVAGLLIHEAKMIPDLGEVFEFYKTRFEIIKKSKNRLVKIKVKKI